MVITAKTNETLFQMVDPYRYRPDHHRHRTTALARKRMGPTDHPRHSVTIGRRVEQYSAISKESHILIAKNPASGGIFCIIASPTNNAQRQRSH